MRKILIAAVVLGVVGSAVADEYDAINSISSIITDTIYDNNKLTIKPRVNTDKSKVEALKGTWTISYNDSGQHTDKLVIDDILTVSNGEVDAKGKWYFDSKGDGQLVFCSYQGSSLSIINSDYLCVTVSGIILGGVGSFKGFAFAYSGDAITHGQYGTGFSPESIAYNIILSGTTLTGYRGSPPAPSMYKSNYDLIQWDKRGNDNDYCIDILTDNGVYYDNMHPLQCGANLLNFSPKDYVRRALNYDLPLGFSFRWKVWSRVANQSGNQIGAPNYGGNGYEGRVVVGQ